jgi:hypothetical protein
MVYLARLLVFIIIWRREIVCTLKDEMDRKWKKPEVICFRYYSGIRPETLRKIRKIHRHDCRCLDRDSNLANSEKKPTWQKCCPQHHLAQFIKNAKRNQLNEESLSGKFLHLIACEHGWLWWRPNKHVAKYEQSIAFMCMFEFYLKIF